ncbi:MAG: hypothetical protein R2712_12020 [Vicinamibacterales bacterium]
MMVAGGRPKAGVMRVLVMAGLAVCAAAATAAAQAKTPPTPSGGNGKMYIGTYAGDIQIFDEATEALEGRIVLKTGIPRSAMPSQDRTRFYVLSSTYEQIEVVDIAARSTLQTFNLREGNTRTRVVSMTPDPTNTYLVLLTRAATKLTDRWEIGPPVLQQFDLASGRMTRTIPWPRNEERETVNLRFSPDGKLLYMFGDEIIILETTNFTEVETWPYEQPVEAGLGRISIGSIHDFYDPPAVFTGLFTMQDPVQQRRIMGIGRLDLTARSIDFKPIGPAEGRVVRAGPRPQARLRHQRARSAVTSSGRSTWRRARWSAARSSRAGPAWACASARTGS